MEQRYCGKCLSKCASPVLIKFMTRLIRDADRKVSLILDNLRVHHARKVKAWMETRTDEIEVFLSSGLLTGAQSG